MHLRPNEQIVKVYQHHPFPYALRVLKIVLSSTPFYFLLFLFREGIPTKAFVISAFVITGVFVLVLLYDGILYWLDHLIITTQRLIHVNWRFFTLKHEYEADLNDIQDIETREQGIFSYFRIFDFGDFKVQTAASRFTIFFQYAPDPEGIKHFVFSFKS